MGEKTKTQLLDHIAHERAQWEALLRDIGEERMTLAGVMDEWSCKDVIVHLTTWWRRDVAGLENIQRGEQPEAHPSQRDVQIINDWIYYTNRDRPLEDVLHDAQAVWQHFTDLIVSFPEQDLMEQGRFAWLKNDALGPQALAGFVKHFHEEHEAPLRAWLAQLNHQDKEYSHENV